MASLNRVMLIGRLGGDPELRSTSSGMDVTRFSIATSEFWNDKSTGEKQEKTEWHKIVVWGRQAKSCKDYLSKGKMVYIEGRIQSSEYDDKDGIKRRSFEINASNVIFLSRDGKEASDRSFDSLDSPASGKSVPEQSNHSTSEDDIPF